MRENKFRGKRVDNKKWVFGSLVKLNSHFYIVLDEPATPKTFLEGCEISLHNGFIEVIPESVGQFTGLHDKNKKPVYEGDVLKAIDPNGEDMDNITVEWDDDASAYTFEDDFDDYDVTTLAWGIKLGYEFEIIGNIRDNPELIGK